MGSVNPTVGWRNGTKEMGLPFLSQNKNKKKKKNKITKKIKKWSCGRVEQSDSGGDTEEAFNFER